MLGYQQPSHNSARVCPLPASARIDGRYGACGWKLLLPSLVEGSYPHLHAYVKGQDSQRSDGVSLSFSAGTLLQIWCMWNILLIGLRGPWVNKQGIPTLTFLTLKVRIEIIIILYLIFNLCHKSFLLARNWLHVSPGNPMSILLPIPLRPALYSLPSKSPCLSRRAHYFKYESNGWTFPITPSIIILNTGVAAMLEGLFK